MAQTIEEVREGCRRYYNANKQKISDLHKEYYNANQEKVYAVTRKWAAANPEKVKEYANKSALKCRERRLAYQRKPEIMARAKAQRDAVPIEDRREYANRWRRNRLKTCLDFRLRAYARDRLRDALAGTKKPDTTFNLIGCSLQEMKAHISSLWTPGMTWENYGYRGWHIDHIIPCASFDFTDPDQIRKCFHFSNLQPLWALDNIRKGAKILVK